MTTESRLEIPAFNEAVKQFQDYLAEHDISPAILWVFREDVVYCKGRLCIKEPLSRENPKIVESLYERAREQGSGIRFEMLCLLGSRPCCYIWLPQDPMDRSYSLLLVSKFAVGVPLDPHPARLIRNPLAWQLYKLLEGETEGASALLVDRLPRRPN